MSSGNDYQKLLVISSLLGILGSIATILGLLLGTDFSLGLTNIFGLVIIGLLAGILIICLITFISSIRKQGFTANDERPAFFMLLIFVFAPTKLFSLYSTPMYYLLVQGNAILGFGTQDYSFYITYIGIALVYLSFIITGMIYLWKNRMSATSGLNLSGEGSSNPIIKLLRIIGSILSIIASVGIILYIFLNDIGSGFDFDLAAIALVIMIVAIIVTAIMLLLGNFGVGNLSSNEGSLLLFILILSVFPGYNPYSGGALSWTSPIIEFVYDLNDVVNFGTVNTWHWILLISLIILVLAFSFLIVTKFYSASSSYSARVKVPRGGSSLEAKKKKGKFPTGPPSGPPASTGPPGTPPSGPPTGTQPTVTSAPPQPPSFMPTDAKPATPVQSDNPTCPFCGKGLRFIDEYKRWYCDGCAQYV